MSKIKKVTGFAGHCVSIASALALAASAAQAEPISDQGLVRAFAEAAPNLKKVSAGGALLPPGMQQGLSMDRRFAEWDVEQERFSGRGRQQAAPAAVIIITIPTPKESNPRVY